MPIDLLLTGVNDMKEILVLKIGTSTIVDNKAEELDRAALKHIGYQANRLRSVGHGVLIVSSAARRRLPHIGWDGVVRAWGDVIGGDVQDFLLTERELDAEDGCSELIAAARAGRIALANANDDQLQAGSQYRSNDLVGARLALHALRAGFKVQYGMLSDVHGVYADITDQASVMDIVDVELHRHLAGGVGSAGATGGMATKFDAAAMTTIADIRTWVAHGRESSIELAMAGLQGTTFGYAQQVGVPR